MVALQYYNQGTIVEWCTGHLANIYKVRFCLVFWAFIPSIEGFKHCRLVMSIDATHLYDDWIGTDRNNQILPLAFSTVEKENFSCWCWFLHHVKSYVV